MCIKPVLACFCFTALSVSSVFAANITFYRDGALLQQKAVAVKGVIDVPLAAGLLEQSLTVVPASGTTILDVETRKTDAGSTLDKELEALIEQRRRLEDRLQALETRETIFTSAAKSQSGKAPRKTKTNPEPIQSIRQGTDFAIAQLEAVYTARRKTVQEIQKIDTRLATARKGRGVTEISVRITVTPPRGTATLHYATSERGWQPQYTMHLMGDGTVRVQLSARITGRTDGNLVRVSSGSLEEGGRTEAFPTTAGSAVLATYRLPVTEERSIEGIFNRFSGTILNNSTQYLPPGDSGLFRNGAYIGRFSFEGISSGRSRVISLGK